MVESSEEEDDFPSMESVTPQSKIDTVYQSKTEKVKSNSKLDNVSSLSDLRICLSFSLFFFVAKSSKIEVAIDI